MWLFVCGVVLVVSCVVLLWCCACRVLCCSCCVCVCDLFLCSQLPYSHPTGDAQLGAGRRVGAIHSQLPYSHPAGDAQLGARRRAGALPQGEEGDGAADSPGQVQGGRRRRTRDVYFGLQVLQWAFPGRVWDVREGYIYMCVYIYVCIYIYIYIYIYI